MRYFAELGSNHNGSLLRAAKLIDAAADAGFQGVKTQQWTVETLYRPEALRARPELLERKKYEMPLEWHEQLSERARDNGMLYGVTPFYLSCIPQLADHGWVDFFKISSYQLLDRTILQAVAREHKPTIVSTGMATMKEVQEAVYCLNKEGLEEITLLHCVSCYPAKSDACNLRCIETLRQEFHLPVGWSDHTTLSTVVRAAIWRWDAECVELHFDLDDRQGAEQAHSWTPDSFAWVRGWMHDIPSSALSQFDGHGTKIPATCELGERAWRADPEDGLRPIKGTV